MEDSTSMDRSSAVSIVTPCMGSTFSEKVVVVFATSLLTAVRASDSPTKTVDDSGDSDGSIGGVSPVRIDVVGNNLNSTFSSTGVTGPARGWGAT